MKWRMISISLSFGEQAGHLAVRVAQQFGWVHFRHVEWRQLVGFLAGRGFLEDQPFVLRLVGTNLADAAIDLRLSCCHFYASTGAAASTFAARSMVSRAITSVAHQRVAFFSSGYQRPSRCRRRFSRRADAGSIAPELRRSARRIRGSGRARKQQLCCRAARKCLGRVIGLGQIVLGEFANAFLAVDRQEDGRHQRDQCLIGADVRGRLFAADVLLAGGQA